MKNYLIITRFSVINLKQTDSWHTTRNKSLDEISESLFDENRLRQRLKILSELSIPNISKAADSRYIKHILVTSTLLPDWCKSELNKCASEYPFLSIEYIDPYEGWDFRNVINKYARQVPCNMSRKFNLCTIRLDDDDVLCKEYFEKMDNYNSSHFSGFGVSFPKGYRGIFNGNEYTYFSDEDVHYIALGLAYIAEYDSEKNEFTTTYNFPTGTHLSLSKRMPVIIDSSENLYIRTISVSSDIYYSRDSDVSLQNIERRAIPIKVSDSIKIANKFNIKISSKHLYKIVRNKDELILNLDSDSHCLYLHKKLEKVLNTGYTTDKNICIPAGLDFDSASIFIKRDNITYSFKVKF